MGQHREGLGLCFASSWERMERLEGGVPEDRRVHHQHHCHNIGGTEKEGEASVTVIMR